MDVAARQTAVRQTYWQLTLVLLTAHLATAAHGATSSKKSAAALNAIHGYGAVTSKTTMPSR